MQNIEVKIVYESRRIGLELGSGISESTRDSRKTERVACCGTLPVGVETLLREVSSTAR